MQLKKSCTSITAFAPATCANVIVGFDILGLALSNIGDTITLTRREDKQLVIEEIDSEDSIPTDPQKNVAAVVIDKMCQALNIECGFTIRLVKGIPLSSGMGGSAASAVAAVTALNGFLETPLSLSGLANFALYGEALASGQPHADNIVPSLYGGLTLTCQVDPIKVIQLPIPQIQCVVVHPQFQLRTRDARNALSPTMPLATHVKQSAYLASFVSALYQNDLKLLQESLQDVVIEPQRAKLVPGFYDVKQAALDHGAIGASLSGAGPSMVAFAKDDVSAQKMGEAMKEAFKKHQLESEVYISEIAVKGAMSS